MGTTQEQSCILSVRGFRLMVHLGWGEEERAALQPIKVDFKIRFEKTPTACQTDDLVGTVDYGQLTQVVRQYCESKPFKLIEHMAFGIHAEIRKAIAKDLRLLVTVTKDPPIPEVKDGASFSFGDAI
ncbi:MAG: dihydroneopterin aldolase [Bdellovibrionota bacterium]